MRGSTFALIGAATLCLSACGKREADVTAPETNAANMMVDEAVVAPDPAQAFADKAASSDAFEIASSRLALEKSGSAKVKAFAQQMIKAHTDSTAKLKAAAASATPALVPDPALTPEQQGRLDTLNAAFDTAYIAEQRSAHEATLAVLRDYSANGASPPLRTFATDLVPTVTAHLNMATALKP